MTDKPACITVVFAPQASQDLEGVAADIVSTLLRGAGASAATISNP